MRRHLVLYVLVTQLQLHDVLKGPEEGLVEMEMRKLSPAGQYLHQHVVDKGHCLLGYMALLVTGCLKEVGGYSIIFIMLLMLSTVCTEAT